MQSQRYAGKALVEMDCIPSPRSNPKLTTAFSGGEPDLETLLASHKAKANSRPWSGASTDTERAGATGDAPVEYGDEDVRAPSPRSDKGTAFEPEQDDGDSPTGTGRSGLEAQPLHDSLQSKQGSRRRWAGNASASLNR